VHAIILAVSGKIAFANSMLYLIWLFLKLWEVNMKKYSLLNERIEQGISMPKETKSVSSQINTKATSDEPTKPIWDNFFKSKNLASEDFMCERDFKFD